MKCKLKSKFASDNILIREIFFEETNCFLKKIIFFDERVYNDLNWLERNERFVEIICKIILPSKNKKKSLKSFSNEEFQEIEYDSFFKNNVKKELNKNFKIIVQRKNEELKIIKKDYLDFFIKTKNFKGNLKDCPKDKIVKISEIIIEFLEDIEFSMENFLDEYEENYLIKEVKKIRDKKTKLYENPNKDFLKQYQSKLSKNEIENLKKIYDKIFFEKIEINKIKKEDFLITDEEKEIWLNQEKISPEKFTKLKANFDRKCLIKSKYNESDESKNKNEEKINKKNIFLSPKEIKKELDKFVIGQEKAKKILSVGAYNHIKRINNPDSKILKSNIFMLGPTGTGKTYLIKKLGEILNVPILIYDASSITATGYRGNDLDSIFNALTTKYNNDYKKCEKAIIYLDEIDKISASEIIADVNGSEAQQTLLTALEGNKFIVNSGSYGYHEEYEFDTSNILFVVGGAFTKMFENEGKNNTIGFLNSNLPNEENKNFSTEKLIKYGMIREFVGRFSSIVQLEKHSKETLKKIILNSKDSIMKQYINIFKEEKIKIEISEEAIDEIVEIAFQKNTGARSLKTVFEELFADIMFEYLGENKNIEKIEISKETIKNKIPKIFYK